MVLTENCSSIVELPATSRSRRLIPSHTHTLSAHSFVDECNQVRAAERLLALIRCCLSFSTHPRCHCSARCCVERWFSTRLVLSMGRGHVGSLGPVDRPTTRRERPVRLQFDPQSILQACTTSSVTLHRLTSIPPDDQHLICHHRTLSRHSINPGRFCTRFVRVR